MMKQREMMDYFSISEEPDMVRVDQPEQPDTEGGVSVIQLRDTKPRNRPFTRLMPVVRHIVLAIILIGDAIAASIFGDPVYLSLICYVQAILLSVVITVEIWRVLRRWSPRFLRGWDCIRTTFKFLAIYIALGIVAILALSLEVASFRHTHGDKGMPLQTEMHIVTCVLAIVLASAGVVLTILQTGYRCKRRVSYKKIKGSFFGAPEQPDVES